MPFLNRYEKVTYDNCGTPTTKLNLARHKKSCSAGTLFCTQYPNFSKKLKSDLNHHTAKKHSAPKPDVTFKCKLCYQEFPGFYTSHQQKNIQHGFPIKKANVDPDGIINELDDANLKEELGSCQHFLGRF